MDSKLSSPLEALITDLCQQITIAAKRQRQEHNEEYDELVQECHKYRNQIDKLQEENDALIAANIELRNQLQQSQRETILITNFVKNYFEQRIERRFGFVKAPESSSSTQ